MKKKDTKKREMSRTEINRKANIKFFIFILITILLIVLKVSGFIPSLM